MDPKLHKFLMANQFSKHQDISGCNRSSASSHENPEHAKNFYSASISQQDHVQPATRSRRTQDTGLVAPEPPSQLKPSQQRSQIFFVGKHEHVSCDDEILKSGLEIVVLSSFFPFPDFLVYVSCSTQRNASQKLMPTCIEYDFNFCFFCIFDENSFHAESRNQVPDPRALLEHDLSFYLTNFFLFQALRRENEFHDKNVRWVPDPSLRMFLTLCFIYVYRKCDVTPQRKYISPMKKNDVVAAAKDWVQTMLFPRRGTLHWENEELGARTAIWGSLLVLRHQHVGAPVPIFLEPFSVCMTARLLHFHVFHYSRAPFSFTSPFEHPICRTFCFRLCTLIAVRNARAFFNNHVFVFKLDRPCTQSTR